MINVYHSVCCLQIAPGYTNLLQFSWWKAIQNRRTAAAHSPPAPRSYPHAQGETPLIQDLASFWTAECPCFQNIACARPQAITRNTIIRTKRFADPSMRPSSDLQRWDHTSFIQHLPYLAPILQWLSRLPVQRVELKRNSAFEIHGEMTQEWFFRQKDLKLQY
jgi:hypothetical protein